MSAHVSPIQTKKPWENPVMDTLQYWKFGEYKNFVSVELLSEILQVPSPKDDIDGSMVARVYYQEQNIERIATYCAKDVVTVAQLYLRLQNLPLLQEDQIHFTE
jgi:3'-5' exonuclease